VLTGAIVDSWTIGDWSECVLDGMIEHGTVCRKTLLKGVRIESGRDVSAADGI
jgi:hypothetical protein